MKSTLRSFLALAVCWTALGGVPLRAQHRPVPVPPADGGDAPELKELEALRSHYRPQLHPGDPLHIAGLEADGNDLRARTPALERGEHEPEQVDLDVSYQRALAMYGDGMLFHAPLPPPGPAESGPAESGPAGSGPAESAPSARNVEPEASTPVDAPPKPRGPEATPWSVLAGLLVSTLLIAWFLVRVRPALMAPLEAEQPAPETFVWRPTRRPRAPIGRVYDEAKAALPLPPPTVSAGVRVVPLQRRP